MRRRAAPREQDGTPSMLSLGQAQEGGSDDNARHHHASVRSASIAARANHVLVAAIVLLVTTSLVLIVLLLVWRARRRRSAGEEKRNNTESRQRDSLLSHTNVTTSNANSDRLHLRIPPMSASSASSLVSWPIPMPHQTSSDNVLLSPMARRSLRRPDLHISTRSIPSQPAAQSASSAQNSAFLTSPQSGTLVDENADRVIRALAASPVVSALLRESFDQEATRGDDDGEYGAKSFDWHRCTFAEEEEKAMWLPEDEVQSEDQRGCRRLNSQRHHRSLSEPVCTLPAQQTGRALSDGDRLKALGDDTSPVTRQEKEVLSEIVADLPLLRPSTASSRSRSFVVLSRPSSAVSGKSRMSMVQREGSCDSLCSTASLRRAGALAIRSGTPITSSSAPQYVPVRP